MEQSRNNQTQEKPQKGEVSRSSWLLLTACFQAAGNVGASNEGTGAEKREEELSNVSLNYSSLAASAEKHHFHAGVEPQVRGRSFRRSITGVI